jgi:transcriptional regulator with XRE-family HTH domain
MLEQKTIGENFHTIRKSFGLSRSETATRCCLTKNDINKIESGRKTLSPNDVLQIASGLKCNACDLLLALGNESPGH